MKRVMMLDTSIGTSNIGDFIIMECVRDELKEFTRDAFVYNMPTHTPAFNGFAVMRNSLAVRNYASCDLKFVGGSNILVKDLLTHYPQWNVNSFNYKPLKNCILVGAGAGAGEKTNAYTKKLYGKLLSHEYIHSVRDNRSREYTESLGLKALNTGCVTMWALTPDHCSAIPRKKADNVVFTLTASAEPDKADIQLIDILRRNYSKISFFVQGDKDAEYLSSLGNTQDIEIIPPSLDAYREALRRDNTEYVGTRLHGGIYALRNKKRAIIISIDERASAISSDTGLVTVPKTDIGKIEQVINSEFETKLSIPFDNIEKWKSQFRV